MTKQLEYVGSSLGDLREMPKPVRDEVGFSLRLAQEGHKAINAVPLAGFGSAGVLEITARDRGNTFRAVYTVQFEEVVYVLHVFQKKSKSGIKTPPRDKELIERRLKVAKQHYERNYGKQKERYNGSRRKQGG
jgi:phage-related protein